VVEFPGRLSRKGREIGLLAIACVTMLPAMFVVSEEAAVAIRAAYEQEGELSAAIEVRCLFPGITDNAKARECARTVAGWKPLPAAACQITPLRLRGSRARPTKA
jgi:hypothetical protein